MKNSKKIITFLLGLASMPCSQVAAVEWSYGVKVGGTTSHLSLHEKHEKNLRENFVAELRETSFANLPEQVKKDMLSKTNIKSPFWNPWFAVSLYTACDFNNHIGASLEVFYNKIASSIKTDYQAIQGTSKTNVTNVTNLSTHTIGLPIVLAWNWAGLIPSLTENSFRSKLFAGLQTFCFLSEKTIENGNGTESSQEHSYDKFSDRLKLGFITGQTFEWGNGLLLEVKNIIFGDSSNNKEESSFFQSYHLSVGYNFARLSA